MEPLPPPAAAAAAILVGLVEEVLLRRLLWQSHTAGSNDYAAVWPTAAAGVTQPEK